MLQGIFPVIPTLFTNRNELDLAAQRRVIRFALDADAHGLVFPGVAIEYSHLSLPEHEQLLVLVAAETAGKVPLVGGASTPAANEVVAAGTIAMKHGIRHLMIMAPVGLGSDVAAHRTFFQQVAAGLPEAEIIPQNAPDAPRRRSARSRTGARPRQTRRCQGRDRKGLSRGLRRDCARDGRTNGR